MIIDWLVTFCLMTLNVSQQFGQKKTLRLYKVRGFRVFFWVFLFRLKLKQKSGRREKFCIPEFQVSLYYIQWRFFLGFRFDDTHVTQDAAFTLCAAEGSRLAQVVTQAKLDMIHAIRNECLGIFLFNSFLSNLRPPINNDHSSAYIYWYKRPNNISE